MKLIQATSIILSTTAATSTSLGDSLSSIKSNEAFARHLQFNLNDLGGCPKTCSSPEICTFYETLDASNIQPLIDGCNENILRDCAPPVLSTACGLCGGPLLASFAGEDEAAIICAGCEFVDCCDGGGGFEACEGLLPEELLSGVLSEEDTTTSTTTTSDAGTTTSSSTTTTEASTTTTSETTTVAATAVASETTVGTTTVPETTAETTAAPETTAVSSTTTASETTAASTTTTSSTTTEGIIEENGEFDGVEDILGADDFWGGLFGGADDSSDDEEGDDLFGGIGDFIGGLFGNGENDESENDDLGILPDNPLEDLFVGGNGSDGGLGGFLDGIMEVVGGLFGDENGTDWLSKGNFSGWDTNGMFGSSMNYCNENSTCPVEGFCDCMNGDISKCSFSLMNDICSPGAAFSCAPEGFEEMCNEQCPTPSRKLQGGDVDFTSAMFSENFTSPNCMMCQVARCCETEGSTMDECAMEIGIDTQSMFNLTQFGDVLDDVWDNLTSVVDELIGNLDEVISNITIPEFCPTGTCGVEGFCDCFQGDFTQCNEDVLRNACDANSFFECGPNDFEQFCSSECDGDVESIQDMVNMALCSMCSMATCCKEEGSADTCIFGNTTVPGGSIVSFVPEDFVGADEVPLAEVTEGSSGEKGFDDTESQSNGLAKEAGLDEATDGATNEADYDSEETVDVVALMAVDEDGSGASQLSHLIVQFSALALSLAFII